MKNKLSELLGILNSINYDEIINELEISSLKKWIVLNEDNNDPIFQEIIKKLNKILDDNAISKTEKQEIINITGQYYNLGNFINNSSELIGILEGILADCVVNEKEIERLKKWLRNNKKLAGTFIYDRLNKVFEEQLTEGILNDEIKHQLHIILTFLLKDNTIVQKINVLKENIKSKEIIGNKLIKLVDDYDVVEKIHMSAIEQLKILINRNCSVYAVDSEIIFLSLSLIALLNYDSNFWDYVREKYEELYSKFSEQKIEGQIRNVINKYKLDDEPRIISYVLKNAIVPKPYLPSFFDFIYDIYRLNFNYSIDPNLDLFEEFSFVYDSIKKSINYESDDLTLNVTHKTYKLIKTTKELILDENNINNLIELSINILKIIDSYYWTNNIVNFENEYFKYGFEKWKVKSEKTIQESKSSNNGLRSRWEPEFKLKENQVFLLIPNHKIRNFYDYTKLQLQIYNDDKLIYQNERPEVYDIIGGYRIEQKEGIKIDKPLEKVRYVLLCDQEVIFNSKGRLYREYIFFDDSGNELKNNKDYTGLAMLCSKCEVDGMQKIYSGSEYIISYKNVKSGEYLKVENDLFNFSTVLTPGIIGQEKSGKVIIKGIDNNIYGEVEGIVYESKNKIDKIVITINGKRYKMSDFNVIEKQRGLYHNYFIKMNLESNSYDINIEELENNNYSVIKRFSFIVDRNYNFNIEQLDIDEYLVIINYLNKSYIKNINLNDDDINYLSFDDENISFVIPNQLNIYKLDDGKWYRLEDLNNYIWINDISTYSKLKVNCLNFTSVQVKDEHSNLLITLYPTRENYYNVLSIGNLRSYASHNYIYLDFLNEKKKIGFLKIYCKCLVNENLTNIYFDKSDHKFYANISFYGKGNIIAMVTDEIGKLKLEQKISSTDKIEIGRLDSFINYKFEIIEKSFGFTLKNERILYTKNIKYYSFDNFVGRYFQIYSVDYDQIIMKKFANKTRLLYNTYIEILERVGENKFIGNIYIHKGEKKYIDKVNPVEIEFASDPDNNSQILTYITNEGEMLFNDFERHTILNNLDSINDVPIYSYIVNMERKR